MSAPYRGSAPHPPRFERALVVAAAVACALCLAQACAGAFAQEWTYDEPLHLEWSRRLLLEGETERASQANFDSKTPLNVANILARRAARRLGVRDPEWLRFSARLPGTLWLAALLAGVGAVVRARYGAAAALAALTLVAADPNLPAHAGLVTVDVAFALASLLTLVAAWGVFQRPGLGRSLLLAAALAFAFTAKFTAVLLLPALALPLLRLWPRVTPDPGERRRAAQALAIGALLGTLAFASLVAATYGFQKVGVRLGERRWRSGPMSLAARLAPALPAPFPAEFLSGIDICLAKERKKDIAVSILGHRGPGPVWYYFLASWMLKTPVLLLLAEVLGLAALARGAAGDGLLRLLMGSLVLNLLYLSLVFRYQIGYRYALMCLPLLAVLAGTGLARRVSARALGGWALAVALGSAAEQLAFPGDALSFSNLLVQPKRDAFRWLGHDSNLDYGQNRERAEAWAAARGVVLNPIHPLPGDNAFTVAELGQPRHRYWLDRAEPLEHYRHTVLLFRVDPALFSSYLDEARSPLPAGPDDPACAAGADGSSPPGTELKWAEGDAALCLDVRDPTDVQVHGLAGSASFGPASVPRRHWDPLLPGTVAWYRLRPGLHVFGLMRGRDLRARLTATTGTLRWRLTPGWPERPAAVADRPGRGTDS